MPHGTSSDITITPIPSSSKVNFGAIVTGVDLNNLDDDSLKILREAIYTHKVIVVKDQQELIPAKQFEFVCRIDPDVAPVHGIGTPKQFKATGGVLSKQSVYHVPGAGGVRLVGAGYHGTDHYGLKDVHIQPLTHADFQAAPLSAEQLAAGQTRFMGWHFDGLLYGVHPSRVTVLRCIKAPKGSCLTLRWDDGSGRTMEIVPGRTAFISTSQLYDCLKDEEKKMLENSRVEYAPHPFTWTGTRKQRTMGIGLTGGGDVVPLDKLPEWTKEKVLDYPMVWINPVTGEKALQVHPSAARKLFLRFTPDGEVKVVEDLEEIRLLLNRIFDRIVSPEYVFVPPSDEGDVVMWNNWGIMHSAVEYPASYGSRIMHQTHIASSTAPAGAVSRS